MVTVSPNQIIINIITHLNFRCVGDDVGFEVPPQLCSLCCVLLVRYFAG